MKHVIHKGIEYLDMVVIDGNIVLQSIHQDVVFEDGYIDVYTQLSEEYHKQQYNCPLRDYISEYQVAAMLEYIKERDGVVVVNNVN